jgi:phage terminase large subunit GpA-like protein
VVRYVRGNRVRTWQLRRTGARNEALDCRVYALAVIDILGIDLNGTVDRFMRIIGKNPAPGTQAIMTASPRKRRYRSRGIDYAGDYDRTG